MFEINTTIQGLDKLQERINEIENLIKLQGNNSFNTFLKQKVLETLESVMATRLVGGTTNDEEISLYRSSNHIEDVPNGFVLYNDATIDVGEKLSSKYPNGKFSIALAFEYGTGIVGEGTYEKGSSTFTPWEYNVNNYNFGWKYRKNGTTYSTYGYQGFEIYRNVVDIVKNNLNEWIKEYKNRKEV